MKSNRYGTAVAIAKQMMKDYLKPGMICLDATLGNGYDTKYILDCLKGEGFLYSFDIQEEAIESATRTLKDISHENYKLILDSHENVSDYLNEPIDFAIFNLGYLPKGKKTVFTKEEVTLKATKNVLRLMKKAGLLIIIAYPGHEEGKREAKTLEGFLASLPQDKYNAACFSFLNQKNNPPMLMMVEKRI